MPLIPEETAFLAGYTFEYLRVEVGPATRKVKERGWVYSDLAYLLDAYVRNNAPEISMVPDKHGNLVEYEEFGRYDPNPPDPPWPDRETVQRRNAELQVEKEQAMKPS